MVTSVPRLVRAVGLARSPRALTPARVFTILAVAAAVTIVAEPAFAAGGAGSLFTGLDRLLNSVIMALSGTTGRAIATVALIVLAIAWLTGRIHWGTALVWACAVAVIVGAPTIVAAIT